MKIVRKFQQFFINLFDGFEICKGSLKYDKRLQLEFFTIMWCSKKYTHLLLIKINRKLPFVPFCFLFLTHPQCSEPSSRNRASTGAFTQKGTAPLFSSAWKGDRAPCNLRLQPCNPTTLPVCWRDRRTARLVPESRGRKEAHLE